MFEPALWIACMTDIDIRGGPRPQELLDRQPAVAVVVRGGVADRNAAEVIRPVRSDEVDADVAEAAHVIVADRAPLHSHARQIAGKTDAVAPVAGVARADDVQVRDRKVRGIRDRNAGAPAGLDGGLAT